MGKLQHKDVGSVLTESEYDATDAHEFASQATGDLAYADAATGGLDALAIGSANQVLIVSGGKPAWSSNVDIQGTLDVTGVLTLDSTSLITGDMTFNDNVNLTFGTGGDVDLDYDGTDLVLNLTVVGTGDFVINGGSIELDDSEGVTFGTGKDATIQYDGTDLIISPAAVGSGDVKISGGRLETADNEGVAFGDGDDASILWDGTDLVIEPGAGVLSIDGEVLIDHGAGTAQALTMRADAIATGLSTLPESQVNTADWFSIERRSDTTGGAQFFIGAEDAGAQATVAFWELYGGEAVTTKDNSNSAKGLWHIEAFAHDDANGSADITANGNVFTIGGLRAGSYRTVFIVDIEGDIHYDGSDAGAFDEYDDISLVRALDIAKGKGVIESEWDRYVTANEQSLVETGILGDTVANGGMVNLTKQVRLHNGALWQLASRLNEVIKVLTPEQRRTLALE